MGNTAHMKKCVQTLTWTIKEIGVHQGTRRRWEDDNKIDLKEKRREIVGCITLALEEAQ